MKRARGNRPLPQRASVSQLVTNIEAGDKRSEEQLYRQFLPLVKSVLRQMTDDASLVEDLSQDTLLTVLLRIRSKAVNQPERLASYIAQTARYSLIGWFRRKGNQQASALDVAELKSAESGLEEEIMAVEQQKLVKHMIEQLTVTRDREILARNYLHEEDKASLCQRFNLPDQHFDRVISRARGRFKKIIQAQQADTQMALLVT